MKRIVKEGYVTPRVRDKKSALRKDFVNITDCSLHENIRDSCVHELRQHLPRVALLLYRFDDDD